MVRRALLCAALLAVSGCEAVLNFNECNKDEDCAARNDGGPAFCTSDHLCVNRLPDERLCQSGVVPATPDKNAAYIVGLFQLSGNANDKDTALANAASLAIEQIQQVASRPIAMVLCDTVGDPSVPGRSLDYAVAHYNTVAVLGPTTSGNLLSVAPQITRLGLLAVTPSATSPAITQLSDGNLIWRTAGSDTLQAPVLVNLIPLMILGRDTAVNIAYVDNAYGNGLKSVFLTEYAKRFTRPIASTIAFAEGSDMALVATRLASDTPDYTVLVADTDAPNLMGALYNAPGGLSQTQFLFTDGALGLSLFGAAPSAGVLGRVRGTAPALPLVTDPVYANFRLAYIDRFQSDPANTAFVANAYDAAFVIALAIASVPSGQVTSTQLVAAMQHMAMGGLAVDANPSTDFNKGATALQQGQGLAIRGASGPLSWDMNGDLISAPIAVWGVKLVGGAPMGFCTLATGMLPCP